MPDKRTNRGAHPQDAKLFAAAHQPALRQAVHDFSWLLSHAYARPSALKLVGDKHQLTSRQRVAVDRSACSDAQLQLRRDRHVALADQNILAIDGFNLLITIESALSGALVLRGRDGCLRDLASIHGTYRRVDQTVAALQHVGQHALEHGVQRLEWWLDRPVSNSGRLAAQIRETLEPLIDVDVQLHRDPDAALVAQETTVVSADRWVLDRAPRWTNLAAEVVATRLPDAWLVDLSQPSTNARGLPQ